MPEDARILLWGGGIWDWLDAPTVIRATARLPDDVHLVFQGVKRPALLERDEHAAGAQAIALARELGLEERVHFNHDWVPYEQRGAWLLDADLGVSAHPAHLETRFAYRTRIADYLWAGLPVVTSAGDVLGDHVATRGLGRAVPPGDDLAFAHACPSCSPIPGPPGSRSPRRRTSCAGTASCSRCFTSAIPARNAHPIGTGRVPYAARPSANMHRSPSRPSPPTAPPSSPASSRRTRAAW